jgi:hypothetical protein
MENIYIEILRIGAEKMHIGETTTFKDIEGELNERGYLLEPEPGKDRTSYNQLFQSAFYWYINSFTPGQDMNLIAILSTLSTNTDSSLEFSKRLKQLPHYDRTKTYIKADAFIDYMHYVSLQEARVDSKKSRGTAKWALIITSILALASIIIQVISLCIDY